MISGKFHDTAYEAAIRAAISRSRSCVILLSGFVRREDTQSYLRACNVVARPYNEILGSGSAILAPSFGRPVIAPAIEGLKDLIGEGCGFLYDPSQHPGSPGDAMRAAMGARFDEAHVMAESLELDLRESAKTMVDSVCGS